MASTGAANAAAPSHAAVPISRAEPSFWPTRLPLHEAGAASNFSFIEPMKALPVRDLPSGDWLYELKFDGYRALAVKAGKEVRLISRNQINFGNDYPQLIDARKLLTVRNVVIDGEITALDSDGKTSFRLLQSYGSGKRTPLVYYAFDLLRLEGTDLRAQPFLQRRKLLAKLLRKAPDYIR